MATQYKNRKWIRQNDWPVINGGANNTINLLVSDTNNASYAFVCTVALSGTYSVDWGDNTASNAIATGATASHTYTIGTGTACSKGYTTFKIVITATQNITRFYITTHSLSNQYQYFGYLDAFVNTSALTSMANMFYVGNLGACPLLENITLPSTLNSVSTMDSAFINSVCLQNIDMPISMSAVTTWNLAFFNCVSLQNFTFPATLSSIQNFQKCFEQCYSLKELIFPSGITTITDLSRCINLCNAIRYVSLPTTLNSLTTMTLFAQNAYSLTKVIFPNSMNNLTSLSNAFVNNYSLESITLPTNLNAITTINSMCDSCYNLSAISVLSSTSSSIAATNAFKNCERLTSISTNFKFSTIGILGTTGKLNNITSITFSSAAPFSGSAPQFDMSYCNMSAAQIEAIFTALPSVAATIKITGCTGAATCDQTIATLKGWTVSN